MSMSLSSLVFFYVLLSRVFLYYICRIPFKNEVQTRFVFVTRQPTLFLDHPKNTHNFFFLFSKAQGANFNQSINCNRLSYHREKTAILIKKSKKNKRQSIGKAFVKRQKYKSGGEIRFNNNVSSHRIFVIHVVFPSRVEVDDFDE